MAAPKKPTPKKPEPAAPIERDFTHLKVRSVAASFRRCGRAFAQVDTLIAAEDLSDDEIRTLMDERELVVTKVTQPVPEGAGDGK